MLNREQSIELSLSNIQSILLLGRKSKTFLTLSELININKQPTSLFPLDVYAIQPFPKTIVWKLYCMKYLCTEKQDAIRLTQLKMVSGKWAERNIYDLKQEKDLAGCCKIICNELYKYSPQGVMELVVLFSIDYKEVVRIHECTFASVGKYETISYVRTATSKPKNAILSNHVKNQSYESKMKRVIVNKIKRNISFHMMPYKSKINISEDGFFQRKLPKSDLLTINSMEIHKKNGSTISKKSTIEVNMVRPQTAEGTVDTLNNKLSIQLPVTKKIEGRRSFLIVDDKNAKHTSDDKVITIKEKQKMKAFPIDGHDNSNCAWNPRKLPLNAFNWKKGPKKEVKRRSLSSWYCYPEQLALKMPFSRNNSILSSYCKKSQVKSAHKKSAFIFKTDQPHRFLEIEGKVFTNI